MLTIDSLRAFGANVEEGMGRCMGREDFYLRLVKMARADSNIDKLRQAVADNDLDKAFEAAHALKGVTANLALVPLLKPVSEMTELLRACTAMDYQPLMNDVDMAWNAFTAIVDG